MRTHFNSALRKTRDDDRDPIEGSALSRRVLLALLRANQWHIKIAPPNRVHWRRDRSH